MSKTKRVKSIYELSDTNTRKSYWEKIFRNSSLTNVGWYQPHLRTSLNILSQCGIDPSASIIDVGGGNSTLVDDLIAGGYTNLTVLDVSPTALDKSKARLKGLSNSVTWIEADITQVDLPSRFYDVWHDRALFHFLIRAEDREKYIATAQKAIKPGGHLIIATFAQDGPTRCSGLETMRYSPEALSHELGDAFTLVQSLEETHLTPGGTSQQFSYAHFKLKPD